MRLGFSIIELLVAIVILTIGMLALAATAGIVAGHVGDGGRLTNAAHVARTVLDSLAARGCAGLVGGAATHGGTVVTWTVARDSAAATVDLGVGSSLRRAQRHDRYQTIVPCDRP